MWYDCQNCGGLGETWYGYQNCGSLGKLWYCFQNCGSFVELWQSRLTCYNWLICLFVDHGLFVQLVCLLFYSLSCSGSNWIICNLLRIVQILTCLKILYLEIFALGCVTLGFCIIWKFYVTLKNASLFKSVFVTFD